jgi:hypothetical protein
MYKKGSNSRTPLALVGWTRPIGADICPAGMLSSSSYLVNNIYLTGHYCPMGSIDPQACPPGKFSISTGNINASQCLECTPGFYCPNSSTIIPLHCPSGFYCPLGTSYFNLVCDEGYFCPLQSALQTVRILMIASIEHNIVKL